MYSQKGGHIEGYTLENVKKYLSFLPTRQLLSYRDKAYQYGGGYDPTDNHQYFIPMELIKEELNKREHVPSKKEGKKLRRLKQKAGE